MWFACGYCPQYPLPHGAAVHVAPLKHGVSAQGCFQGSVLAVLADHEIDAAPGIDVGNYFCPVSPTPYLYNKTFELLKSEVMNIKTPRDSTTAPTRQSFV